MAQVAAVSPCFSPLAALCLAVSSFFLLVFASLLLWRYPEGISLDLTGMSVYTIKWSREKLHSCRSSISSTSGGAASAGALHQEQHTRKSSRRNRKTGIYEVTYVDNVYVDLLTFIKKDLEQLRAACKAVCHYVRIESQPKCEQCSEQRDSHKDRVGFEKRIGNPQFCGRRVPI